MPRKKKNSRTQSGTTWYEAKAAYASGDAQRAKRHLKVVLRSSQPPVDAVVLMARLYAEDGHYALSLSHLQRAIELSPENAELHLNTAEVHFQAGDQAAALKHLHEANALDPQNIRALDGLWSIYFAQADAQRSPQLWIHARSILERSCELDGKNVKKLWRLADCYERERDFHNRRHLLERIRQLDPDDKTAAHLLAVLDGEQRTTADPRYAEAVFDAAAEHFDEQLLGELNYQVPQQIHGCINSVLGDTQMMGRVLDLGCGTGLVAQELIGRFDHMTGVDVSVAMIEQARQKCLYDHLEVATIDDFLDASTNDFDWIVAGDVFNYIGDLGALFDRVRRRMASEGAFVFSIEVSPGDDIHLGPSGRFSHTERYIEYISGQARFAIVHRQAVTMRKEGTASVSGIIYVLKGDR